MRGEYAEMLETTDLDEARCIAQQRTVWKGCQILMERNGRYGITEPGFEGLAKNMGGWRTVEVLTKAA